MMWATYAIVELTQRHPIGEALFGPLSMALFGLIVLAGCTPLALVTMAGWTVIARIIPVIDQGSALRRAIPLTVGALILAVPMSIAMLLTGDMQSANDGKSPFLVALAALWHDPTFLLYFFPWVFAWFVGPRLLVRGLRGPIALPIS